MPESGMDVRLTWLPSLAHGFAMVDKLRCGLNIVAKPKGLRSGVVGRPRLFRFGFVTRPKCMGLTCLQDLFFEVYLRHLIHLIALPKQF
jgi:hypothetical protein